MKAIQCPTCKRWVVPTDRMECMGCGHVIPSAPATPTEEGDSAEATSTPTSMYLGLSIIVILSVLISAMHFGRQMQYEADSKKYFMEAKNLLTNNYLNYDEMERVESLLYQVDNNSSFYKDAQGILPGVQAKVKKLKAIKEKEEQIEREKSNSIPAATPSQRIGFAQAYENLLLSRGMDATVKAVGDNRATLKITHVLINRAIAYQMINDSDNKFKWSGAGFSTIIFEDGYGGEWSYSLKK